MAGEVFIRDPLTTRGAKVDDDGRLHTIARVEPLQHSVAHDEALVFQLRGDTAVSSGTDILTHIKNDNPTQDMVVTYIRHQVIDPVGGTAFPTLVNYFRVGVNSTWTSGGTPITPVNTNTGSGNAAQVTAYTLPVVGGTNLELDRWYTKAEGDMNPYNKEGSLIIPPNKTMELAYVNDLTSGTVSWRLTFLFSKKTN